MIIDKIKLFVASNLVPALMVAILIFGGLYYAEASTNETLNGKVSELTKESERLSAELERMRQDIEARSKANEFLDDKMKKIEDIFSDNNKKLQDNIQDLINDQGVPGSEVDNLWDTFNALVALNTGGLQ